MKRKTAEVLLLLAAIYCLSGRAAAASLPAELEAADPAAASMVSGDAADGFGLTAGLRRLWSDCASAMKTYLLSGVRSTALLLAGVVLLGTVECAAPAGREALTHCVNMAGALWLTAAAAGDLTALIGLGRETIGEMSLLSKALLPCLAAAEAASGGVSAAAARQVAAVFFADLLLTAIDRLLLPMVYLYIGVSAAGAVLEGDAMDRVGALLKKIIGWALGGMLTLYTGYLTVSGAIAGAADAQAVKLAKSAVSAAVPVVGGILSDAAGTVLAGAGLLKGMVGAFGVLAAAGICLLPFLRLGCQYLLYQGAAMVAAAAGPKKLTALLTRLGDALGLVLAMTGASALALLISLISSLLAVAP